MLKNLYLVVLLIFSAAINADENRAEISELGFTVEKDGLGGNGEALKFSFKISSDKGSLLFAYLVYTDEQGSILKVPVFMHENFLREKVDYSIYVNEKLLHMLKLELFYSAPGKEGDSYLVVSEFQDLANLRVKTLIGNKPENKQIKGVN